MSRVLRIASAAVSSLVLAACAHSIGGGSEETAVLRAVVHDPFLAEMVGKTPDVYLDRVTDTQVHQREDDFDFWGDGENTTVDVDPPEPIKQQLAREIRKRARMWAKIDSAVLDLPPFFISRPEKTTRHVRLSRPALSDDRDYALVTVELYTIHGSCPTGYAVLLRRTASGWKIAGRGDFWIV